MLRRRFTGRLVSVGLSAAALACAAAPLPSSSSAAPANTVALPTPTAAAPPVASSAAPASSRGEPSGVPPSAASVTPPAEPTIDPEAWLAEKGVAHVPDRLSGSLFGCRAVRVGAPPRDGLFCPGGPPMEGSLPGGESLFPLVVAFVDGKTLRVALRVPLAAGPLDREMPPEENDPSGGNYVQLDAVLSTDGLHLSVRDRPGAGCLERLAEYRKDNLSDPNLKGILTPHIRVMEAACRSRGEYTWQGDRFTRDGR
jgi:hypothetical protein